MCVSGRLKGRGSRRHLSFILKPAHVCCGGWRASPPPSASSTLHLFDQQIQQLNPYSARSRIRDSLMDRHSRTRSPEGEVAVIKGVRFALGGQVPELVRTAHGVSQEAPPPGPSSLGREREVEKFAPCSLWVDFARSLLPNKKIVTPLFLMCVKWLLCLASLVWCVLESSAMWLCCLSFCNPRLDWSVLAFAP